MAHVARLPAQLQLDQSEDLDQEDQNNSGSNRKQQQKEVTGDNVHLDEEEEASQWDGQTGSQPHFQKQVDWRK